jgi:ribosomal protein S16
MSVIITLDKILVKKKAIYKIVVKDSNFIKYTIDKIGFYNLTTNPKKIGINGKKLAFWLSNGAQIRNKKLFNIIVNFYKNESN